MLIRIKEGNVPLMYWALTISLIACYLTILTPPTEVPYVKPVCVYMGKSDQDYSIAY
jgi:hypothetical protein